MNIDSEKLTTTDLDDKPKDFSQIYHTVDDEIAQIQAMLHQSAQDE